MRGFSKIWWQLQRCHIPSVKRNKMESTLDKGWRAKNREIYDCSQTFSKIVNKILDNRTTFRRRRFKAVRKVCSCYGIVTFSRSRRSRWGLTNYDKFQLPVISHNKHWILRVKSQVSQLCSLLVSHCKQEKIAIILFTAWENRGPVGWLGLTPDRAVWVPARLRSLCCVPIPPCPGQKKGTGELSVKPEEKKNRKAWGGGGER